MLKKQNQLKNLGSASANVLNYPRITTKHGTKRTLKKSKKKMMRSNNLSGNSESRLTPSDASETTIRQTRKVSVLASANS